MEPTVDASLVTQSLNFHGQQLQKIWESERGEDDLAKIGISSLDFAQYQQRQKHFTFQDRGKRLKLHHFVAKEAIALFDRSLLDEAPSSSTLGADAGIPEDNLYALMPPFETFLTVDKNARLRHFFENVQTGELIIGTVINRTTSGMMLKVLCTSGQNPRYVADINVKAFLPVGNIIPAVDKKNLSRNYLMNDTVCCEVLEVIPDTDKMVCGMKGVTRAPDDPPAKPALGLLCTDDFPQIYKKTIDMKGETYEAILEKSPGFNNPNSIQYLSELLGVTGMHCSNFLSLRNGFPLQEYADELRQAQASKWAFRSVAEGIEHFKAGRHSEAFQCLNKALSIDPRNVEGLVARGALYANSGTFKKAIEDFETSLKLNPSHANARKYMGETLVALGRSYEDENKLTEAQKAYEDCLAIIPFHEEAQNSLDFLKSKTQTSKPLIEPAELLLPGLTGNKGFEMKETLKQLLNLTDIKKEKKVKKKKRGKGKKKHHRSSSSSSSSSDSSSSSSTSDSSSSSSETSDSETGHRKKKRSSRSAAKRPRSLSPLSKRMALAGEGADGGMAGGHNSQFNHPYYAPAPPAVEPPPPQDTEYENKVRKFLEMTKEDSDYENKVRSFLEEAAKYKRDRKMQELGVQSSQPVEHEKTAKKRKAKKESKKNKKESKRKRKEREKEEKRRVKLAKNNPGAEYHMRDFDENMGDKKFRDALRKELKGEERRRGKREISSDREYDRKHGVDKRILDEMPDLEELESKLNAYYAKVEKDAGLPSKRQDNGRPHGRDSRSESPDLEVITQQGEKPKWKMHLNSTKEKIKKKDVPVKPAYNKEKAAYAFDESSDDSRELEKHNKKPLSPDKNVSVRRAMALKEPPAIPINNQNVRQSREPEPPGTEEIRPPKQNIVLDKFGSFRLAQEGESPLVPEAGPGGVVSVGGQAAAGHFLTRAKPPSPRRRMPRSPPPQPPRPRSPSPNSPASSSVPSDRGRDRRKYRDRSSRSRSSSRRSESRGSRPSPARSGASRSRSRSASRSDASRSYYSRSRSRSRSGSRDRFRRMNRRGNGWRGRGYERGTYYRPRFQTYNRGRGRGGPGGDFRRDDRRYNGGWRDDRGRGRGFRPRQRGGNRGRPFRGGFRDYRDRRQRFSRSRSPDRSRRSRSYTPDSVRRHDKADRSDRYSERGSHRSEGEYDDESRFVDRKEYDGKWADSTAEQGGGGGHADQEVKQPESVDKAE